MCTVQNMCKWDQLDNAYMLDICSSIAILTCQLIIQHRLTIEQTTCFFIRDADVLYIFILNCLTSVEWFYYLHKLSSLHIHHSMLAVEGGAIANLYAVLIARHKALPEVKNKGLANLPQLVVFQSERVWSFFAHLHSFCPVKNKRS